MTYELIDFFKKTFPVSDGVVNVIPSNKIDKFTVQILEHTYSGIISDDDLVNVDDIKESAESIFENIDFDFINNYKNSHWIIFEPDKKLQTSFAYKNHMIQIHNTINAPFITYHLDWEKSLELNCSQRNSYIDFAMDLHHIYYAKSKQFREKYPEKEHPEKYFGINNHEHLKRNQKQYKN